MPARGAAPPPPPRCAGAPPPPRNGGEGLRRSRRLPLPACGKRAGVRGDRVALGLQLRIIVEDEIDLGERGGALGSKRRGAARDNNLRPGMLSAGAADRLSRLPFGFGGDGAGVDDDGALEPGFGGGTTDDL